MEFSAEEFETALITPNNTLGEIHIPLLKVGAFCCLDEKLVPFIQLEFLREFLVILALVANLFCIKIASLFFSLELW